ncbi:hypothetical protein GLAREA_12187 [Glarea lozoyensis ATCC 20868]|uniref:Uncharacterized protein n=1 Tax=Glarea lozoyensis (strain ATCC 20868 / MF5171) TaxID=1116229 RepID=S3D2P7_GLAL2|nr:uncharacterized protein GLAREA_12187 [Glarea lozoyensis ATCC 20868]EPE32105.1 hypothetical protein GLAREA_12187 [Glarea lozoyensis ATCC 20868]
MAKWTYLLSVGLLTATKCQLANANDDNIVVVSTRSHIPVFEPALPTDDGLIRDLCDFTAKLVADHLTIKPLQPRTQWRPRGHCWYCEAMGLTNEEAVNSALLTGGTNTAVHEQGESGHREWMAAAGSDSDVKTEDAEVVVVSDDAAATEDTETALNPNLDTLAEGAEDESGEGGHQEWISALDSDFETTTEVAAEPEALAQQEDSHPQIKSREETSNAVFRQKCKGWCCKNPAAKTCGGFKSREVVIPKIDLHKRQKRCPLNPPFCQAIQDMGMTPDTDVDLATWESLGAFAMAAQEHSTLSTKRQQCPLVSPLCQAIEASGMRPETDLDLASWETLGVFALDTEAKNTARALPNAADEDASPNFPPRPPPKTIPGKPNEPKPPGAFGGDEDATNVDERAVETVSEGAQHGSNTLPTLAESVDGIEKAEFIVNTHGASVPLHV